MKITPKLIVSLACLSYLTGCNKNQEKTLDYSDFENRKITWNEALNTANQAYFLYIYSNYCSHCQEIKSDIFAFLLKDKYPMYIIEYSKEIPVSYDVEFTIGSSDLSSISIKGTPTLIHIVYGKVVNNLAGTHEIISYLSFF